MKKYPFYLSVISILLISCVNKIDSDVDPIDSKYIEQLIVDVKPFYDVETSQPIQASLGMTQVTNCYLYSNNLSSAICGKPTDKNRLNFTIDNLKINLGSVICLCSPSHTCSSSKFNIDFSNQHQIGNNNLDHLSSYDYMISDPITADNPICNIQMKHLGAICSFILAIPNQIGITKVIILADKPSFGISGVVDPFSGETVWTEFAESIGIKISDCTVDDLSLINIAIMIGETNLREKELTIYIEDAIGTILRSTIIGQDFRAGHLYTIAIDSFDIVTDFPDVMAPWFRDIEWN